ncbi:MAG: ribosomal protein S18-alanine N-acetyltransferase [bacterium]
MNTDSSLYVHGEKQVLVRQAELKDLAAIAEIEQTSFSSPWGEDLYRMELVLDLSRFLVADADKEVIGYACGRAVSGEGHILKVAVRPDWRRRGVATKLMEVMTDELYNKGARLLWLEVRQSNQEAKGFYSNLGFRPYGIRKGYYSDNREDALVLAKRIEG